MYDTFVHSDFVRSYIQISHSISYVRTFRLHIRASEREQEIRMYDTFMGVRKLCERDCGKREGGVSVWWGWGHTLR